MASRTIKEIASKLNTDPGSLKKRVQNDLGVNMDTALDEKNLAGVTSGLRGAQVAMNETGAVPQDVKSAQSMDPVKPAEADDGDADHQQLLYKGLIATLPTLLGAALGGYQGGAVGAQAGGNALTALDAKKKDDEEKAFQHSLKMGELGEKQRQNKIDESKLDIDREKISVDKQKIANDKALKEIDKQIAGMKNKTEQGNKLRDDFNQNQVVKDQGKAVEGISAIRAAAKHQLENPDAPNPYDDIGLVFAYMKVLDPTSVVREGEYKTAANAAPLLQQLGVKWDSIMNGGKLSPEARANLLSAAERAFGGRSNAYNSYAEGISKIAKKQGIDVSDVVIGYGEGAPKVDVAAIQKKFPKKKIVNGVPMDIETEAKAAEPPPDFDSMSEADLKKYLGKK